LQYKKFKILINLIYKSNNGVCLSICGDKQGRAGQGRAARVDTRSLDLLAAHSNRLGGLLAVQTSNLHPNKNIYNKKTRIFLKKKIETK
jgi:hypothetical protein